MARNYDYLQKPCPLTCPTKIEFVIGIFASSIDEISTPTSTVEPVYTHQPWD